MLNSPDFLRWLSGRVQDVSYVAVCYVMSVACFSGVPDVMQRRHVSLPPPPPNLVRDSSVIKWWMVCYLFSSIHYTWLFRIGNWTSGCARHNSLLQCRQKRARAALSLGAPSHVLTVPIHLCVLTFCKHVLTQK